MIPISPHEERLHVDQFRSDVLAGLSKPAKSLPCKYFYDEIGSRLFDEICELDEYYLTRTESRIMEQHSEAMARSFGPACVMVEYGSGSSWKTRLLLDRLDKNSTYVPVDISREHLRQTTLRLKDQYPRLQILPVCADFTQSFDLPALPTDAGRTIGYFPGSTVGNFPPSGAVQLLTQIKRLVGPSGGVLIGVDLPKSPEILEAAYDDEEGVTSRFNLNLLERINRELDAEIPIHQFMHQARFNERESRVEMHLVSTQKQLLSIENLNFAFQEGETIHTENSYKYSLATFKQLAAEAGFRVEKIWCDEQEFFSVQFLTVD